MAIQKDRIERMSNDISNYTIKKEKSKMSLETFSSLQFVIMCLASLMVAGAGFAFIIWLFIQIAEEGNF